MSRLNRILPRIVPTFAGPTVEVARSLIGKYLVRDNGAELMAGKIVEVEAYVGPEDKACHASKGRTAQDGGAVRPPLEWPMCIFVMACMKC
jgi:DNA-3-methyladenine glycosylase